MEKPGKNFLEIIDTAECTEESIFNNLRHGAAAMYFFPEVSLLIAVTKQTLFFGLSFCSCVDFWRRQLVFGPTTSTT